jgi:hypothetical protein
MEYRIRTIVTLKNTNHVERKYYGVLGGGRSMVPLLAEVVRCPFWRKEYGAHVRERSMVSMLTEGIWCPC